MKRFFLFILLILILFNTPRAQLNDLSKNRKEKLFSTGTKSISGNISWSKYYNDGDPSYEILNISPSLGYFLLDNLAITLSLDVRTITYQNSWGDDSETSNGFGVGAKYFMEKLYIGLSYNSFKYEDSESNESILYEGGYLFGINRNIFIDIGLDYFVGIGDNNSSNITIGIGISSFF